jgi:hypothetical protein
MKNVKHILAAAVLSLSLSASALAGDIYGVGAPAPATTPADQTSTQNVSATQETATAGSTGAPSVDATGAAVEAALSVLNTVLALF